MTPELSAKLETIVLSQVRRLICEMNEIQLLAYRQQVRKECGYEDDGGPVQ